MASSQELVPVGVFASDPLLGGVMLLAGHVALCASRATLREESLFSLA
jgi:hypothetical protein